MSDYYIDPTTKPWGYQTNAIWGWLRSVWMDNVPTVSVPNTEANEIEEYREITQFWYERKNSSGAHGSMKQYMKSQYENRKVDAYDNRGRGYRF